MIKVVLNNGTVHTWGDNEYDDYRYDGKVFIVVEANRWIGIYNMDYIISVVVKEAVKEADDEET